MYASTERARESERESASKRARERARAVYKVQPQEAKLKRKLTFFSKFAKQGGPKRV